MVNFCSEFEGVEFICLQNGKFKFEKFGRFIMAMGTDRNIQDSLLSYRNDLMKSILRLYHCDLNKIFEQFDDPKNFSDKLYHIFETYLPILQYNSNVLQNVYKCHLPKSASNLFLNSHQILENVANRQGILGGVILYNNKVICSQLSSLLTKVLVATDPVRVKTTAEIAKNLNFYLPSGSQIIKIFITHHEYSRLQQQNKKVTDGISFGSQNILPPLPFSIRKKQLKEGSMIKRDKSIIFSNIPEEEVISPEKPASRNFNRPNHLPLKLKTIPPESGIASIVSFDETDSYPDFIGKASVAQTPIIEMKPMTGPISSIFAINNENEPPKLEETKEKVVKKWDKIIISQAENPFKNLQWKIKSLDDINRVSEYEEEFFKDYQVYNTITDPCYPIMREGKDKRPLSKILFDDYQSLFSTNLNANQTKLSTSLKKLFEIKDEKKNMRFENDPMIMKRANDNKNSPSRILRNQKKKMLKLPIKSFSLEIDSGKPSTSSAAPSTSNGGGASTKNTSIFDSPSTKSKKYMGGLQLTPLMSKLTLLAMSENESFTHDQPTPNYFDTPVDNSNRSLFNRLAKVDEKKHDATAFVDIDSNEMKCVDLFVCGEKNMTLMVIADENSFDRIIIQQMFEICVNQLSRLEQKLNDVINVTVDLKASDYSFVTFNRDWEVIQRSGTYDLNSTLLMHDHFNESKNLSDIILRTNDSIIYGHNNSGNEEVFYQHTAKQQSGFPAPSEFTIVSQAKRKLERDQSLVLF